MGGGPPPKRRHPGLFPPRLSSRGCDRVVRAKMRRSLWAAAGMQGVLAEREAPCGRPPGSPSGCAPRCGGTACSSSRGRGWGPPNSWPWRRRAPHVSLRVGLYLLLRSICRSSRPAPSPPLPHPNPLSTAGIDAGASCWDAAAPHDRRRTGRRRRHLVWDLPADVLQPGSTQGVRRITRLLYGALGLRRRRVDSGATHPRARMTPPR